MVILSQPALAAPQDAETPPQTPPAATKPEASSPESPDATTTAKGDDTTTMATAEGETGSSPVSESAETAPVAPETETPPIDAQAKTAPTPTTALGPEASTEETVVEPEEEESAQELAKKLLAKIGVQRNSGEAYPGPRDSSLKAGPFNGCFEGNGAFKRCYHIRLPKCFSSYENFKECSRVRGIYGGSLWATFHGMQWPYIPKTGIGLSGSVWVDTGYEKIKRGDPNQRNITYWLQEGRFVFRVTPTFNIGKNLFIQGQVELVANKDQTLSQPTVVDTDDLWIKVGMWDLWDIQVGRFEAFELYHFGMGLELNTLERRGAFDTSSGTPSIYGVNYAYYRPNGIGNIALHAYPVDFLRVEGLLQYGNDVGLNSVAGRGAAILDFGWLKLKGGGEYKKQKSQQKGIKEERKQRGFGGSIQFVLDPWVETGFNYGKGIVDHTDMNGETDYTGTTDTYSYGGFLNFRVIDSVVIGGGANYTWFENIHEDDNGDVGEFWHLQTFGAVQYMLFEQLYLKFVGAFAKANFDESFTEADPYNNKMKSFRVRVMYNF